MATLAERLQEYLRTLNLGQVNQADTGYDPEYETSVQGQVSDLTRYADRLTNEGTQDEIERTRQTGLLNETRDKSLDMLKTSMADQGILRSGINVKQQGEIGKEHTRNVDDLSRNLSQRALSREENFRDRQTNFQSAIDRLKMEKTQRQVQKAEEEARRQAEIRAREEQLNTERQETARLEQERQRLEQEEQQRVAAMQPQPTPTGQYEPPPGYPETIDQGGYQVPVEWLEAIKNDIRLAEAYGIRR